LLSGRGTTLSRTPTYRLIRRCSTQKKCQRAFGDRMTEIALFYV